MCLLHPPCTEPELDGKKPPPPGPPDEISGRIYLVDVVVVGVDVPGEVDLLAGYRLALEGVHEDVDIPGIEFALLEPAGSRVCPPVGEEPVDTAGDLPFEVCHHIGSGAGL